MSIFVDSQTNRCGWSPDRATLDMKRELSLAKSGHSAPVLNLQRSNAKRGR